MLYSKYAVAIATDAVAMTTEFLPKSLICTSSKEDALCFLEILSLYHVKWGNRNHLNAILWHSAKTPGRHLLRDKLLNNFE